MEFAVNAQGKIAAKAASAAKVTTMTSREFNQHTGAAKTAADSGPVVITDRGRPAYVLLSNAEYERLAKEPSADKPFISIAEALADPQATDDIDLMDFIPPRRVDKVRFSFDEDE